MATTVIRNVELAVVWNEASSKHEYARDLDIVFEDGVIVFIGRQFVAADDAEFIDGRGLMALPGFVNVHSHPSTEPMNKGLLDEIGSPGLYYSSLYEYMPLFRADDSIKPFCAKLAFGEMLLSGVTTVVDLSNPYPGWFDAAAGSGLRVCLAPMFRSASWATRNGHSVDYVWDEEAGERGLVAAVDIVERAEKHPSGRLNGMIMPAQVDTCTEQLLRDSFAEAERLGVPWQTHAAQSVTEFHEMTRRTGRTPVGWLAEIGVLAKRSIVGHGIFLDHHDATPWSTRTDLLQLSHAGASIAHCPTVFARRGITLRHLGRYREAGINVALGTDTYPHNMLDEARLAAYLARTQAETPYALTSADLFEAITCSGARALGRSDIGRLARGARADISLVNLRHSLMQPGRDPVRSLLYAAGACAIKDVYVDGRRCVAEGRVLTLDLSEAAGQVSEAQQRLMRDAPDKDWAGRSIATLSPPTFRTRTDL